MGDPLPVVLVEDDAHIKTQGLGTEPACWMELGYATGYLSTVCDRLILFREVECRSMGSERCRFLLGSAETMQHIYDGMSQGVHYEAALEQMA